MIRPQIIVQLEGNLMQSTRGAVSADLDLDLDLDDVFEESNLGIVAQTVPIPQPQYNAGPDGLPQPVKPKPH